MAEIREWVDGLEEIRELIGDEFARTEPRNNAIGYIRVCSRTRNGRMRGRCPSVQAIAPPDGMQRLLSTTDWDPEVVRDALFRYVKKHLRGPGGEHGH